MVVELKDFLTTKYGENVTITNEPVEAEVKPFEVTVNGSLIYSMLTPVAGEKGPILFSANKWWGEVDQSKIDTLTAAIDAAFA